MAEGTSSTSSLPPALVAAAATGMAGLRRDLMAAREAYDAGDLAASRQAHTPRPRSTSQSNKDVKEQPLQEPGHNNVDNTFRKCAVYGGFEGMVCETVVVAALSSVALPPFTVIAISIGCLLALAVAFAARDYIRYRSDHKHFVRERAREKWELSNCPEGEIQEMIDLYVLRGVSEEHARKVIELLSGYEEFFVDLMMTQELGMLAPDSTPAWNALSTLSSFAGMGGLPIVIYVALLLFSSGSNDWASPLVAASSDHLREVGLLRQLLVHPVAVASMTAILTSLAFGSAKRRILPARQRRWQHIAQTFIASIVVAMLAYAVTAAVHAHLTPLATSAAAVCPPPSLVSLTSISPATVASALSSPSVGVDQL